MVIIGDLAYETTICASRQYTHLGGSAYYAAIGAQAAKNKDYVVIASVGEDFNFDYLEKIGIPKTGINIVPHQKTALFVTKFIENSGERVFYADFGAIEYPSYNKFESYSSASIVYLAGSDPERQLRWIDRLIRDKCFNGTIVSDVFEKYCCEKRSETLRVIQMSDIIFMNEMERKILNYDPVVNQKTSIIKMGNQGAVLVDNNGVSFQAYPQMEGKVIDTNGAGDILASVFLTEFTKGSNCKEALQLAVNLATLSVFKEGVQHILQ